MTEPSPLHDFADRALRTALQDPENLRAFLSRAMPTLVERFDCSQARLAPRDFLLDDWRGRESDLLFEIPYRDKDGERITLVCVLIEHQSSSDPRMPLRTLLYAVLYWEREWRRWEIMPAPKPAFRLAPIVPIVLHTAPEGWNSARTLDDLIGGPDELRAFAPRWEPLFWELANQSSDDLRNSNDAFLPSCLASSKPKTRTRLSSKGNSSTI